MASTRSANVEDLSWLLNDFANQVVGARHAVLLSSDGLLLAHSDELGVDLADQLAAMASSLQSLATQTGQLFDGGSVKQTLIEMDRLFLFLTKSGQGTRLAVFAEATADIELIGHEMTRLVTRVGQHLSTPPRATSTEPTT